MKIVLPLSKTELHQQSEILLKRYPRRDKIFDELQDIYRREEAGYQGEKQLDYYLNLSDLAGAYSLAGLRLKGDKHYFQIDRMILTQSVCIIIESKNLKGQLLLNEEDQLIQQTSDSQKIYENPYTQVKLQAKQLRQVLNQLGYSDLPVHPLVVFTNKNAILNLGGTPDLIALHRLTFRIDEILNFYQRIQDPKMIQNLAYRLLSKHTVRRENILEKFNLNIYSIRTGVLCSDCERGKMVRVHGTWICEICKQQNQQAHISALSDYAKIVNPLITNKTARYFLEVESRFTVYRIFKDLNLPISGNRNSTHYDLSKIIPV